jgi:hypothetical protein
MLEPEMPGRRRRVLLPVWLDRRAEAEAEAAKQARWRVLWDRAKQLVECIRGLFR